MSGWIGAWGNAATVTNLTVTGSEIISVNTSTDALRITQTGTGNAIKVEDSANPDSTPFIVDNAGYVVAGHTAKLNSAAYGYALTETIGTDNQTAQSSIWRFSADGDKPRQVFYKSRSSTIGVNTVVQAGDSLGEVVFAGADDANYIPAASIAAFSDGTPGINDMPGRLEFYTTADNTATLTKRLTIDKVGNIYAIAGTTSMTNGFFYIPAAAGAPSGVPTSYSGRVPMYYDTTNNNFYVYNGAWKKVLLG